MSKNQVLKSKKVILAVGEATHQHQLICDKEVEYSQEGLFVDFLLKETGVVKHVDIQTGEVDEKENHGAIVLPAGKYSKTNQVEFSPFDQSVNQVFD